MKWRFSCADNEPIVEGHCVSHSNYNEEASHRLSNLVFSGQYMSVDRVQSARGDQSPGAVIYHYELRLSARAEDGVRHMFGTWDMGNSAGLVHLVSS